MRSAAESPQAALPTLHVLGAGRAGAALARALCRCDAVAMGVVCNNSLESAREAVGFIGAGQAEATPAGIDGGLLMIGVPDASIGAAASAAAKAGARIDIAFHLSGQHDARVLEPLANAGAATASMHPVVSFARPELAVQRLAEAWCVLEGDAAAVGGLRRLCQALGMHCIEARGVDKPLYHAATVAASNLVCALLDLSARLAERAGLEPGEAQPLLNHLAAQLVANAQQVGPRGALTGPIERGDTAACQRVASAVGDSMTAADRRAFFALADLTVDLAGRKGSVDETTMQRLKQLFAAADGSP